MPSAMDVAGGESKCHVGGDVPEDVGQRKMGGVGVQRGFRVVGKDFLRRVPDFYIFHHLHQSYGPSMA